MRSRPWAGIDVGSYSVKLLAVGGQRHWVSEAPIAADDPAAEGPASPEAVARAIHTCFAQAGLSSRSLRGISTGIAGPDVIVKQIAMPLLEDDEVPQALRYEARKHLPFDPLGMIVDYQILSRSQTTRQLDLLLAAVSQQHVERHLEPFRLIGLDSQLLDATPLALTNALVRGSGSEDGAALLLDIGHQASHLTLYQSEQPYFSRRLDLGGWQLTRAIAESTHTSFEEAERWKLEAGSGIAGAAPDWNGPEMLAILEELRRLAEEVRRSLAFYRTVGHLPQPLQLWISGSTARLPGLDQRLGEILDLKATTFDPLPGLRGERRGRETPGGPQFAQAFGLALRTM